MGTDSFGLGGFGVVGASDVGVGVEGYSDEGNGVWGFGKNGVYGLTLGGIGVFGDGGGGSTGVAGRGQLGVFGVSWQAGHTGVWGDNEGGGFGVVGTSRGRDERQAGVGVFGQSDGFGPGVVGIGRQVDGVTGSTLSEEATGVSGFNSNRSAFGTLGGFLGSVARPPVGVFGANWDRTGHAGYFAGNVYVAGVLEKWANFFKIDHPLDPANKYLRHAAVESSDMKNIYDGTAQLDAQGEATVELPAWFEALNRDFHYQLTAIGAPSPDLHIAQEIAKNRFKIAGGKPGARVSWQITGIRHDAIARAHPLKVEEEKASLERGTYLNPVAHGKSDDQSIEHVLRSRLDARGKALDRLQVSERPDLKSLQRPSVMIGSDGKKTRVEPR